MLSKTDYKIYLDTPLHLWAIKHDHIKTEPIEGMQLHIMLQGQVVEKLAKKYLQEKLLAEYPAL
ncbi:MAG: hypothetical protein N2D54_03520 [Chloroflexota bacterium]